MANPAVRFHTTQTLADKLVLEQQRWKRFSDDLLKQSRHYLGKKMLRQFSLSIKVPLTRVEVLLLYEQTLNPATMKAEQKRLAELINNPISILKVDCPA